MITGEDIRRLEDEEKNQKTKLVVIDTMQFFEIEIAADVDAEAFVDSELCRQYCAQRILNQTIDLKIDRVGTEKDEDDNWKF